MKKYIAFFDLDKTILDTYSPKLYYKYEIKHGKFPLWKYYKMVIYTIFYKMGIEIKDMETMVKETAMRYKGQDAKEAFAFAKQWFEEDGKYHIRESIREEVEFHRSNGAYLSLISASPNSIVAPFADYLNFDDMICTRTIIKDGKITGEIGTYMYEKNKVIEAKKLCEKKGFDIKEAYFYSDSISDLPLLEAVGNPICVNPDLRLKWIAKKRGWRIIYK